MNVKSPASIARQLADLKNEVRTELRLHMQDLGIVTQKQQASNPVQSSKDLIRAAHKPQRFEIARRAERLVKSRGRELLSSFASGEEIDVKAIEPELKVVRSGTRESDLFRLATLLWSVPVSTGYGRRMRFLVSDRQNGKLIGILGLSSPVFNLEARDKWVGWTGDDRKRRLIHVMDAYVLGAVPPYSGVLGGKLIGALIGSDEVSTAFRKKYCGVRGRISKETEDAFLAAATTTSAMGRSSLYNRLRLSGLIKFERIGWTKGFGHFHVPDELFARMRELLDLTGHKYADGYKYGDGPNWRMRCVKAALELADIDVACMKHGVQREVFGIPLAENWREFLCGEQANPRIERPSADEISKACKERWLMPRAERRPEYRSWTREQTWGELISHVGE